MFHYVYRITHIPTGCWYVGIRTSKRWPGDDSYLGSGKALASLPREELSKRVLVIVETREEAARIEAQLVDLSDPMCLNLCEGGSKGTVGYRPGPESRELMAAKKRGTRASAATRLKMSESHKGVKHSEEHRRKNSEAKKGNQFWRARKQS